jgi:hypothetical protein
MSDKIKSLQTLNLIFAEQRRICAIKNILTFMDLHALATKFALLFFALKKELLHDESHDNVFCHIMTAGWVWRHTLSRLIFLWSLE